MKKSVRIGLICAIVSAGVLSGCGAEKLTPYDMKRAKEFILSGLPALPEDPSNKYADQPKAAELGKKLFFETALSANNSVACGSCHQPDKAFQDGLPLAVGIDVGVRRTMHLRGAQWGNWFFWDGRKDSQWSQALEPFESVVEHGMTRDMVAREVLVRYKKEYEDVFGPAPDISNWPYFASPLVLGSAQDNWYKTDPDIQDSINRVYSNIGKAIAAYERKLLPLENKVDRYFASVLKGETPSEDDNLSPDEIMGFKLFTGKARCDNCHSGPLYSDQFFHNNGAPIADIKRPDYGRAPAVLFLKDDIFTCLGKYSDAKPGECRELNFMSDDPAAFEGAFKTPSLRGVSKRAPYMHAGQLADLIAVVEHYNKAPDPFSDLPELDGTISNHGAHSDVKPLHLSEEEKRQLIAFLKLL